MFINANVHSWYSLLNSTLSLEKIISYAKRNNQQYVCLTDINNMYGAIEFYDLAIKENLKPIIGLEFKYQNTDLVAYALNYEGYLKLVKFSSFIMNDVSFNINEKDLFDIVLVAKNKGFEIQHKNFYQTYNQQSQNAIAIADVYFLGDEDVEVLQSIIAIKNNMKLEEVIDSFSLHNHHMLDENQANDRFSQIAIDNLNKVISSIDLKIYNQENNIPKFDKKSGVMSFVTLRNWCVEGLERRLEKQYFAIDEKYRERLELELSVIEEKKFEDYFLIVADFIEYAKKNHILVGPGRGSVAGSLIAYALNITDIDPIKYNLVFERFLNASRKTMPDIDTDIMDSRRDEVIEYIFNKYTNDHVCYIATFQRIKAKMAIRDVGRILNIDLKIVDKISKMVDSTYEGSLLELVESSVKLQEEYKKNQRLFDIANQLIDLPRQIGTHAAGIILSNDKTYNIIPIQKGLNDRPMTQYSMNYLERFGLIKIDLLGLKNLTIIQDVVSKINRKNSTLIDINKINLEDKGVFEDLSAAKTKGIFQLESPGMRRVLRKIKPKCLEDISIVSAIYRPGAQKNIDLYVKNKIEGVSDSLFFNDKIANILKPTAGVIVYQEQVMAIVQEVARFNAMQSDNFRRAISKKDENILINLKKEFIQNAIENNYQQNVAEEIFDYLFRFASYGFNHSHSLAYAYISYVMAYLKHHFPLEFFTALLTQNGSSQVKINDYLDEIQQKGIGIKGVDIEDSRSGFRTNIATKQIYFGFRMIKGFGEEVVKKILNAQKNGFNNFKEAIKSLKKAGVTYKNLEVLIKIGSFDRYKVNRDFLLNNLKKLYDIADLEGDFFDGIDLEGVFTSQDMSLNEKYYEDEENYLGVCTSKIDLMQSGVDEMINQLEERNIHITNFVEINEDYPIICLVYIKEIEQQQTKKGKDIWYVRANIGFKEETLTIFHNTASLVNKIIERGWYALSLSKFSNYIKIVDVVYKIKES